MLIFIICWVEMNASVPISQHALIFVWGFRLQTQEQSGIPRIGRGTGWRPVLFDWKITRPSNSNCVVKYTLLWMPIVRCRRAQYTLTAACTLIDKVMSIKRAIQIGGLALGDCTVGTAWGLEGDVIWLVVLLRIVDRFSIDFSIIYDVFCSNNT